MVELLAPAGSLESLHAAVNAGADAVYIGGSMFGARAYADNPDEASLLEGIRYCHLHGKKIYMTVNTLLKEREMGQLYDYMLPYYLEGLDGVIVQDFGVVRRFLEWFPEMEVHASTQMTITGTDGARLMQEHGLTRVVPARELSIEEIRRIIQETGTEVESFIHGAMCYCYSGQCLFSSMIGGRSGNRGRCAQPCRLPYHTRGGKTSCLLSMKDMCTLEILPEILDAGIASLKIEGRMKRPEYTAGVVSIYRRYIDRCLELGIGNQTVPGSIDPEFEQKKSRYSVQEQDLHTLMDLYNRGGFTEGYYEQRNGKAMMSMKRPNHYGTEAAVFRQGKKGLTAIASEPLYRGDVLEIHDQPLKFTLGQDISEGAAVPVPPSRVRPKSGTVLYRTHCEKLLTDLHARYEDRNCKEKINGTLMICAGSPAILNLNTRGTEVSVFSDVDAQFAKQRPIDEESVRKQMSKTGGTPFEFQDLQISMEDHLFLPLSELNDLRRKGLEQLQQSVLQRFRREESEKGKLRFSETGSEQRDRTRETDQVRNLPVNVSVMTKEQLCTVLAYRESIHTVYLDLLPSCTGRFGCDPDIVRSMARQVRSAGMNCFLNFPPVFRSTDKELLEQLRQDGILNLFDGFLLHTVDELGYIRDCGISEACLTADETLYAYNRQAAAFLKESGIDRFVFPAELNARELETIGLTDGELVVYGRLPLMQSAQCIKKNTEGCTGKPEVIDLTDRKSIDFPTLNRCVSCCSTIFNSVPLDLSGCEKDIRRLEPSSVRLSFTTEDASETERILRRWKSGIPKQPDAASTRGHFRRGVE